MNMPPPIPYAPNYRSEKALGSFKQPRIFELCAKVPRIIGKFKLINVIGHGSSSVVYRAVSIDSSQPPNIFAMKVIPKVLLDEKNQFGTTLSHEIEVMQQLKHPNIVALYEVFDLKDYRVIRMEYLDGGSLADMIDSGQRQHAFYIINIMKQILGALEYIHEKRIAHKDIKPENIIFDSQNKPKLVDFGFCSIINPTCETGDNSNQEQERCGTPFYCAPEVLLNQRFDPIKADLWSFGVTMHLYATLSLPFKIPPNLSVEEWYELLPKIGSLIDIRDKCYVGNVISKVLVLDPSQRMSAKDLLHLECFSDVDQLLQSESLNYGQIQRDEKNHLLLISSNALNKKKFIKKVQSVDRKDCLVIKPKVGKIPTAHRSFRSATPGIINPKFLKPA